VANFLLIDGSGAAVNALLDHSILKKFVLTTFFKNLALMMFFTSEIRIPELTGMKKKVLLKITNTTLIVYLIHVMFVETFISHQWLVSSGMSPSLAMFIYSLCALVCGVIVSVAFQAVPWKKLRDQVWHRLSGQRRSAL
jgi:fucose 4-O-acetylase-like acetyltransferase